MHGNVQEWCSDWYAETYAGAGTSDPQGPNTGQSRVLRGGCWDFIPASCRSTFRQFFYPSGYRNGKYGFRVVVDSN
jgi:formylglycine-generating enzyme required for sulfatase activity